MSTESPKDKKPSHRDSRDSRDSRDAPKEFQDALLGVDRVTRVTAGGRQLRFRAAVVIGNGKGTIGLGVGKGTEVATAIEKATRDAKKNLITFPIMNGTIPYDVFSNYKSSSVYLHPASEGTGIIAGGAMRRLLAISGLRDIIAKQHGCKNPITNIRVLLKALSNLGVNPRVEKFLPKKPVVAVRSEESDERKGEREAAPVPGAVEA